MKINQLYQLILINLKEFYREPGILFWGILFPVLMSWGLGIAFTDKPMKITKIAVITSSNDSSELTKFILNQTERVDSVKSKAIIKNEKTGTTEFIFEKMNWQNAINELKRGKISLILSTRNDSVVYNFDPQNPESQLSYLQTSMLINNKNVISSNSSITPLIFKGTRYIDFLIPGILAMGVMMSCMWGLGYTLIERRSKKLLRRMIATPMLKTNYMAAIFIARFFLNFIEAFIVWLFAWLYFDIEIQGSFIALLLVFVAGNITFSGIAILVSARTAKLEIGNGIINAVVTPMMFVAGIFFTYQNFPDWIIPVIRFLPLTLIADSMRAIFNEGAGVVFVLKNVLILIFSGLLFFGISLKIYKWY